MKTKPFVRIFTMHVKARKPSRFLISQRFVPHARRWKLVRRLV